MSGVLDMGVMGLMWRNGKWCTYHLHSQDVLVVELLDQSRNVLTEALAHTRSIDREPLVGGVERRKLFKVVAGFLGSQP